MNTNTARWHFHLVEETPGPSIDDAADFIRQHGGDPWELESLELIGSTRFEDLILREFAASGPAGMLRQMAFRAASDSGVSSRPLLPDLPAK